MNHLGVAREIAAVCDRPLKPPVVEVPEQEPERFGSRQRLRSPTPTCALATPDASSLMSRSSLRPNGWRSDWNFAVFAPSTTSPTSPTTSCSKPASRRMPLISTCLTETRSLCAPPLPGETLANARRRIDRQLTDEHLVIADASRPVALAGVMGGLDTEISEKTRNVLIESAWFQQSSVRATAKRFGMHTEASHRFERGADVACDRFPPPTASPRFSPNSPAATFSKMYHRRLSVAIADRETIRLRRARIERMVGTSIPDAEVEPHSHRSRFSQSHPPPMAGTSFRPPPVSMSSEKLTSSKKSSASTATTGWRNTLPKVSVARLKMLARTPRRQRAASQLRARSAIAKRLPCRSWILATPSASGAGAWSRLKNPLTELQDCMRNSSVPAMLRALAWNLNRGEHDVRLYEIGRLYRATERRARRTNNPDPWRQRLGASGNAWTIHGRTTGLLSSKGRCGESCSTKFPAADQLRHNGYSFVLSAWRIRAHHERKRNTRIPRRSGSQPPLPEEKFRQPLWVAEILLDPVFAAFAFESIRFQAAYRRCRPSTAISRCLFPRVRPSLKIADVCRQTGIPRLGIAPQEIFRGKQVPAGRNIACSCARYGRSPTRKPNRQGSQRVHGKQSSRISRHWASSNANNNGKQT